jgi:hypothetical protein
MNTTSLSFKFSGFHPINLCDWNLCSLKSESFSSGQIGSSIYDLDIASSLCELSTLLLIAEPRTLQTEVGVNSLYESTRRTFLLAQPFIPDRCKINRRSFKRHSLLQFLIEFRCILCCKAELVPKPMDHIRQLWIK